MVTEFQNKVYRLLKQIPKGKVTTYKIIAKKLNSRAYRAVGTALKCNPYPVKVPCHRVVKSDGSIGQYSGGIKAKIKLLQKEGIEVKNKRIDFKDILWK